MSRVGRIRLALAALLAAGPLVALATEPLFDRIDLQGESGRVLDNARGPLALPQSDALLAMTHAERCSAIGGPRGRFRVADGALWLEGLHRCSGDVALAAVYPGSSAPLVATWISGELTAELGALLCRSDQGLPVYERVARLQVDAGRIAALSIQASPAERCAGAGRR